MGTEHTEFQNVKLPFNKGLNTTAWPHAMQDGELEIAQNALYQSTHDEAINVRPHTARQYDTGGQRVTSIFSYSELGNEHLIAVWGDRPREIDTVAHTASHIQMTMNGVHFAGSIFTSDLYWQWVTFEGKAYAVTQEYIPNHMGASDGYPTLMEWDGTGDMVAMCPVIGSEAQVGLKHLTVWNRRLWAVRRGDVGSLGGAPTHIIYSSLGTAGSFTGTNNYVSGWSVIDFPRTDQDCTGLAVIDDCLVIFFRNRFVYIQPGDPNTDPTLWNVKTFLDDSGNSIGCISPYSICTYENALIFLGSGGVYALTNADSTTGSISSSRFKLTFLSHQLKMNVWAGNDQYPAIIRDNNYILSWISNNGNATPLRNELCYVLDLRGNRWSMWTGAWLASCYDRGFPGAYGATIIIGNYNGIYRDGGLFFGGSDFDDTGAGETVPFTFQIRTKAYDIGDPFIQKLFNYLKVQFISYQDTTVTVRYIFDGNFNKTYSETIAHTFTAGSGDNWGENWGSMIWYGADATDIWDFLRKMENTTIGREARYIQLEVEATGQDFLVLNMAVEAFPLNKRNLTT